MKRPSDFMWGTWWGLFVGFMIFILAQGEQKIWHGVVIAILPFITIGFDIAIQINKERKINE